MDSRRSAATPRARSHALGCAAALVIGFATAAPRDGADECVSLIRAADGAVEGRISPYVDRDGPLGQIFRLDVSAIPREFFDDLGSSLQLVAWKDNAAGRREDKSQPVRLFFVDRTSGDVLRNTPVDRINANTIDAAIGMGHLDQQALRPTNFLQHYAVLLTGLQSEWGGVVLNVFERGRIVASAEAGLPIRVGPVSSNSTDPFCR